MRFTGILSLISFLELMERVGYTLSISLTEVRDDIKRLPLYISNYVAIVYRTESGYRLSLERNDNKETAYYLDLTYGKINN